MVEVDVTHYRSRPYVYSGTQACFGFGTTTVFG